MWRSNTFVLLSSLAGPTLTTRPGPGSKILISPRSLVHGTPIIGVWKRGLTSTIYSSCILAGLWSHSRLARSSSSSQTHLVFVNIWQIDENDVGGILKQYKRSQFVWQKKNPHRSSIKSHGCILRSTTAAANRQGLNSPLWSKDGSTRSQPCYSFVNRCLIFAE